MSENENVNPFAGLFSAIPDAQSFPTPSESSTGQERSKTEISSSSNETIEKFEKKDIPEETLLREVFGITLNPDYCGDSGTNKNEQMVFIDAETAEQAIFERLMVTDYVESKLLPPSGTKESNCGNHTTQQDMMNYLFESYRRLMHYKRSKFRDQAEKLQLLAVRNAATALQEPDLFPGHKVHTELLSLFEEHAATSSELSSFLSGMVAEMSSDGVKTDDDVVFSAFGPMLDMLRVEASSVNLITFRRYWFEILREFVSIEALAKLVIRHSTPKENNGRAYSDTLLGSFFSLSCLPKSADARFEFFDEPLESTRTLVEGSIWTAVDALTESLYSVFHSLLKCSPEIRHLTLGWIGNCLAANASRGKLWNAQNDVGIGAVLSVSDGFMINLSTVLLRLCQPFCANLNEPKVLKIDPTYCAAEAKDEDEREAKGLHIRGMSSETCLIPTQEGETREHSDSFGFVTECFFLTHRSLDLGYRVVLEKLLRTNQDLARIQGLYNETRNSAQGNSSVLEVIVERMNLEMTKYLSLRASALAPGMLDLLAKFHAATAFWLIQVNLDVQDETNNDSSRLDDKRSSYAPGKIVNVTFPLKENVPNTLRCIPEFVVENTVNFLCVLKRLAPETFDGQDSEFLYPILTEVIALMESPQRLYNPHLRARLAEGLEALLPSDKQSNNQPQSAFGNSLHRTALFVKHPHRRQIVTSLLQVFVSIEMTGQSVQFEQKFNYRRPMYIVMDYLWKLDEHRTQFKKLAAEAELNMEAVQPPIFLRFINLLMNDAVYLLDEALSNMAQIKQMHHARETGEWNKLPQQERDQQAGYLQHIGMIARFDNILGRETINMLKMLTSEIKSIFCHSTMVDRIASMLNYLLLQLVGPNKRNLKVKDQQEYDFNPANLVLNICEIYINLSQNDNFTLAVSQDGRSYSSQLFKLAENVLVRIGGVGILGDLDNFSKRVEAAGHVKEEEDEILNNAPDDFLDPIMSTLMADPVILPSSKMTVDRQTIARHLLSDQTDPFNRSPLTMDMIQSNTELRSQIQDWIRQRKEEKSSTSSQEDT